MSVFDSYNSYRNFVLSILSESRFIPSKSTERFFQTILETCDDKIVYLDEKSMLFRSQKGCNEIFHEGQIILLPYTTERMIPKADKVKNGRVNTIGIPVLYVSDSIETAIAETRPWINEHVSVAKIKLNRRLVILDLSKYEKINSFYINEPTDEKIINKKVWSDISYAFSMPVNNEDQDMNYIPTQVIGEYLKSHRFDGIKYKSLLSDGYNYALFDTFCCELVSGRVYSVNSIQVESSQLGNNVEYKDNGKETFFP